MNDGRVQCTARLRSDNLIKLLETKHYQITNYLFSYNKYIFHHQDDSLDDLVIWSQVWYWSVPSSKPDSTKDPPLTWAWCTLILMSRVIHPAADATLQFGTEEECRIIMTVENHSGKSPNFIIY
ncbi:hypothetical protein AVEN_195698-1 [Araneus ventricosus]|uniref:Uncharacterized protein n=1 Tax=Araneus ventricosus TaxID=182803 RepID=A0A4Y2ADP6_ARAVE|nr:hypothetical protein AVEN_195698-1 [Araneus ventricosus]